MGGSDDFSLIPHHLPDFAGRPARNDFVFSKSGGSPGGRAPGGGNEEAK